MVIRGYGYKVYIPRREEKAVKKKGKFNEKDIDSPFRRWATASVPSPIISWMIATYIQK